MSDDTVSGQGGGYSDSGVIGQTLVGAARLYFVPPASVAALLVAGVVLGAVGDALLRAPGPPGLNLSLWVAVAALALHRRVALALDRERVAWLAIGVAFAAGLAWRDAPPLKLLSLGCATLTFTLAAHVSAAAWVTRSTPRVESGRAARWRSAAAVARGLVIATPPVVVFGALFMSADAVFAELVADLVRFDVEWIASHILLFVILAWLSTGYLRGFLTGTALPWSADGRHATDGRGVPRRNGWRSGLPKSRPRWPRSTCCSWSS